MTTFIFDVLEDLNKKQKDLSSLSYILPNKRAGIFLKHQLLNVVEKTIFSPEILSIEDFVENLSDLKKISNSELLFEFYTSYCQITPKKNRDDFELFSKWAQALLHDFNEIDRFLIPHNQIFNYLSAIKEIESSHWSEEGNQTDFIKKYLLFWNKLQKFYTLFTEQLLNKKKGYQGLIYREAVENLEIYIQNNTSKQHVFLGFNALNSAEETIIQELLQKDRAEIYWDIDKAFFDTSYHNAALFTRKYKNSWTYFNKNNFNWVTDNYSKEKKISVYGVPKNVGQAKYIGTILSLLKKEKGNLNNTALVLGDEPLLTPILNSLPENIDLLNITMGFPLKSIPIASLFEILFRIHKKASKEFYFKDIISIISHQFIRPLFRIENIDYSSKIIETIKENNLIYLTNSQLNNLFPLHSKLINLLFNTWGNDPEIGLVNCSQIILEIKSNLDIEKTEHLLALEYLYRFNELFNELTRLNIEYHHIKNISTLHNVYKELLNTETLNYQGEPLQGLQVMGMLESRVLDFETVIISSVNEGILPSSKGQNSFIPFDVKVENKMPTYKEKTAIYSYHFYRLLQRAKNVYILYNTEIDTLKGGEKSRFITQLELEGIHKITHQIVAPKAPVIKQELKKIKKTDAILKKTKTVAKKGFSPSSLTNYIRNPIDFYYAKILGIKDLDNVEEIVAANTLGTVVHNTLEDFYFPFVGEFLSVDIIKKMKTHISETVTNHFKEVYKQGNITKGKNLIIYEIAKRYVSNILNLEINQLKQGNTIKIIAIETNNKVKINIPELDFPVYLTGKVDRVDEYNGILRIIDYKTGKVEQPAVEISNWEDLTTDYKKYSKSFQVLTYAYMMNHETPLKLPIEAGIISFKNLNKGFLKFGKKEKGKRNKEQLITQEILDSYFIELKKLILEICNPNIDFVEKEV